MLLYLRLPACAPVLLLCLSLVPNAHAQDPSPLPAEAPLEEVLVTGQQPGPGLWQLRKPNDAHGHVLWILGNYSPLPKKMTWRSHELERVLSSSQVLLAPVSVNASVGPLGGVTLLPSLIGARRNPDDQRLQQVVPAELYARWLPLKAQYLGADGDVERWRPIFAAQELYRAALKQQDLVPYDGVWPAVEKLARKAKVPIAEPEIDVKVEKARAAIKEFKNLPLDDVECFSRTLRRLESDLGLMRDRANAWAVGDVAQLRRLAPVERASACIGVVLESSFMQQRGYGDIVERLRAAWLEAAEESLARNPSTVAVIPIDEILRPGGLVDQLRQKGYTVVEP